MDTQMSKKTNKEVMVKMRRQYERAGREYRVRLIDQAVELFGYHRKAAIRALGKKHGVKKRVSAAIVGRPVSYASGVLLEPVKTIWMAARQPCGKRLHEAMKDWVPAYEQWHRKLDGGVRELLLEASASTLDRMLAPVRVRCGRQRGGTRPGSLLREHIPLRGGMWEEDRPGWLEVDTVALCGGRLDDRHLWMLDGIDIHTTWVEVRALPNRSEQATCREILHIEKSLPFALLGLDSDNGGEFINWHLVRTMQERKRPVYLTRSRPYHKNDNAHVEQKNWTHIRDWFGYERYEGEAVAEAINKLCSGVWSQFVNYFCPSLKLKTKERVQGRLRRRYEAAKTPLERVLASAEVSEEKKRQLREQKARLNPFELREQIERQLRKIERLRKRCS